jgi:aminoglycoside phosphotransferase (APT) family kinase protein
MPPRHVVKLYGPWRWGHHTMEDEARGLELAGRDPDLPAPNLVARGALDDDWRYLVETFVPGVSYSDVRDELDPDDRLELAGWTGRWVRRLHALPLDEEERAAGTAAFRTFIEERRALAIGELTEGERLPGRLLEELPGWLPPLEALLGPAWSAVPLHTDLHDEHVLVVRVDGRFRGSGVIDLNRFRLGHPLYELGPIWRWLWYADRALLGRFIAAADLPGHAEPDFPRRALAWCLLHAGVAQFPIDLPGIEEVGSLDALAERGFGKIG